MRMEQIDVILYPLIPILIIIHLLAAPYTKVEESFNVQAIHDISSYGFPLTNISSTLSQNYDHFSFPGAVPRTFIGALNIVAIAKPLIYFAGTQHAQTIARATLGLINAFALMRYRRAVVGAFGRNVARWYVVMQASQFHVVFYASRTLPNMFAFGLTTLAFSYLLPSARPVKKAVIEKMQKVIIFLFVFAGVVFRSEIAILLFAQLLYLLISKRTSVPLIVKTGVLSAVISMALSVPIDSYLWQKPIWPELAGFYYNAIQGKSADWGTSPTYYYFTSCLPRLLTNPLTLILMPMAIYIPATRKYASDLILPQLLFVAIYSLQPHKEARFIIYSIPPLTVAASLSASYIWARRSKSIIYLLGSTLLVLSILASFAISGGMLLISSLNYPGGAALTTLHQLLENTPWDTPPSTNETIKIHMDVLSCMTGVTRFQEKPWRSIAPADLPVINDRPVQFVYDKTEESSELLSPEFWAQFDYLLMEDPGKAIGAWEVISTISAYSGIEILRPGDGSSFSENLERVYAANNITTSQNEAPSAQDVKDAVVDGIDEEFRSGEDVESVKARLLLRELGAFGSYRLARDAVRQVTGGWWVGPRMEPRIRIMRKVKDPMSL